MTNSSFSSEESDSFECPLIGSTVLTGLCCFFSFGALFANILLARFIISLSSGHLTPNRFFVLNLVYADIVPCFFSLPLYVAFLYKDFPVTENNILCQLRYFTIFIPQCVNLLTLAVISVDRCEVVSSLPGQRRINLTTARYIVTIIWIIAVFSTVLGGAGYWIPISNGQKVCFNSGTSALEPVLITNRAMLGIVSVWIFGSVGVICNRFYVISKRIRNHVNMVHEVLGRNAGGELKTTKISFAYTVSYAVGWLPYGVSVGLRTAFSTPEMHCVYIASHLLAYSTFAIVPAVHMLLDKQMRKTLRSVFKTRKVAPAEQIPSASALALSQMT